MTMKSGVGSMVGSTKVDVGSWEGRPEVSTFSKEDRLKREKGGSKTGSTYVDMRLNVLRPKKDRQDQWTKLSVDLVLCR